MKNKIKTIIIALLTLVLIASAYPLLGCCEGGCGGCGGCCGDDDLSEDEDDDGSDAYESIPTNLGSSSPQTNTVSPGICDGINDNSVSASASKSATASGYAYSYSFTIKACASTVGYSVVLDGPVPVVADSGVANKDRETTRSGSYSSSDSYTQLCIRTGGTLGDHCVPFT